MSTENTNDDTATEGCAPAAGSDFLAGICVSLQILAAHDQAGIWREIVQAVGVNDMLQYAAFTEPEEWELAGFALYAWSDLKRRKPRKPRNQNASLSHGDGSATPPTL